MSAGGKTRLHELPESSPNSSGSGPKKARPSANSGEKSGSVVEVGSLEPFLEKMVQNAMTEVMETWKDELTTHILTSLEAIHSGFETRLQDLEKRRVSDHAVIDQLTDRVSELEMMISRSELEANLVVTGVKETQGEKPKDVFLSICHNKLDTKIAEDDVLEPVEAVRLGPQPQTPANDKSIPASVSPRPRPLLVRTKNKATKTAVMSARKKTQRHRYVFERGFEPS